MNTKHTRIRLLQLVAVIAALGALAVLLIGVLPRPAVSAPDAAAAPAATVVGSETCIECHGDVADQLKTSPHGLALMAAEAQGRGPQCEGCHGPGSLHAGDPSAETAAPLKAFAASNQGCVQCHDKQISGLQWKRSAHHREGVSCLACHGEAHNGIVPPAAPLAPTATPADAAEGVKTKTEPATAQPVAGTASAVVTEPAPFNHAAFTRAPSTEACLACHTNQRGTFALPSHHPVMEGRIGCADCHDPHRPLDERKLQRDTCVTCHTKQRGPHVYEHGAISAGRLTDGCLSCHEGHGSPNRKLEKLTGRGLCLQCHADRVNHAPGQNCASCHRAVHGSNSSRALFRE